MLSHRWLQLSLPRSASPSSAPSQASSQSHAQATPLLGPPGPLSSTATSPPGPSPLGLTPTEAPRVPITSPNSDAGRHHSGMSRPLTANEETSVSAESTASPSENRCVLCCRCSLYTDPKRDSLTCECYVFIHRPLSVQIFTRSCGYLHPSHRPSLIRPEELQ